MQKREHIILIAQALRLLTTTNVRAFILINALTTTINIVYSILRT